MDNIILNNDFIALVPSNIERPKSYVNFDVIPHSYSNPIFEVFSEGENLVDGYFKMRFLFNDRIIDDRLVNETIKLFTNFCFMAWPINKIYYETYQNEIELVKQLINNNFKMEARLQEDAYIDGKYVDKFILATYRE